jgi:NADPH:quinone reductase-like Zn-dependent oxidoreductase
MKAYQFVNWQHPPELREVPLPDPGPGEVLRRHHHPAGISSTSCLSSA